MNIKAGLGEYILQTHNTNFFKGSMGGLNLPNPLWVRQWCIQPFKRRHQPLKSRSSCLVEVGCCCCCVFCRFFLAVSEISSSSASKLRFLCQKNHMLQCNGSNHRQESTRPHHHHHHHIAGVGRRVARLRWPRPRACLQRSAGVWLHGVVSIWSIHLPRGRPGRRLQEGWGRWPSDRLTWDCNALCAPTSPVT